MAEVVGLLRGNDLPQLQLHLQRVLAAVRQSQPSGDADAVGVADIAVLSVDIAQDQIGGLAPHTGQGEQVLHVVRDLSAEALHQHFRGANDVPGLGPPEAAGLDICTHLVRIGGGKGLQRGIAGKQRRRHQIDTRVGALRRQTHGEQQLIVLLIVQRTQRVRVHRLQRRDNGADLFLRLHATSPHPNCNRGCRKRQSVLYCFIRFSTEGRRCRYASAGRRDTAPDA